MITIRGQILVSRTGDDPCLPCVHSNRHRVYVQNVPVCTFKPSPFVPKPRPHMLKHMCAWCRYTRRRSECTHGGVFEPTHGFFPRFFSVPHHTQTHTMTTNNHTTHNTTRRQRQSETETERDRARRQRQREEKREEEIQGRREKMKEKLKICFLNRVRYDCSLNSFSASWPVNSFSTSANCFNLCSYIFHFSESFSFAATVFFTGILHKYFVEGYPSRTSATTHRRAPR